MKIPYFIVLLESKKGSKKSFDKVRKRGERERERCEVFWAGKG